MARTSLTSVRQRKEPKPNVGNDAADVAEIAAISKQTSNRSSTASYEGRVHIGGYYPEEVKFQLEDLELKLKRENRGERYTLQRLLGEAINDLFAKYGMPEIAPADAPKRGPKT